MVLQPVGPNSPNRLLTAKSTDGKLRLPRLGLLDYMLKGFDPKAERDLVFIPVGINYDRVLEDRTLLRKLDPAAPRRSLLYAAARTAAFTGANLWLMVTGRWYRFGYACVNFGRPVSMRDYVARRGLDFRQLDDAARHHEVERVAGSIMESIARIIHDYAIGVGLRMLLLRRVVLGEDGLYRANPADAQLLEYYANAIEQLIHLDSGKTGVLNSGSAAPI